MYKDVYKYVFAPYLGDKVNNRCPLIPNRAQHVNNCADVTKCAGGAGDNWVSFWGYVTICRELSTTVHEMVARHPQPVWMTTRDSRSLIGGFPHYAQDL